MMKIDLSGQWRVKLDAEKQETMPQAYPETMTLPGTTSAAGLGMPNPAKERGCLTDAYRFEGAAWFMRTFTAGDWTGEQTMLTLERTRKTTVYLDGRPIGHQESLCTPHRYFLPPVHAGEHTLVIRVDNTDYPTRGGHLTSPDTQSNWNGITGEISLTVAHTLLTDLTVRPDLRRGCLRVHGHIIGAPDGVAGIVLPGQMEHLLPYRGGVLNGECPLKGDEAFWDEAHPEIHTISIDLDGDVYETTFGLRDVRTVGRRLLINGRETFLRGKVDNLLYPKTGYTPTDVASWMTILGIAKEYGINHTVTTQPVRRMRRSRRRICLACTWRRSCRSGGRSRKRAKKATMSANAISSSKRASVSCANTGIIRRSCGFRWAMSCGAARTC